MKLIGAEDIPALKQPLEISVKPDNDANGFIKLGRDVHSHIIETGGLSAKDVVSLSTACTSLWVKNQAAIFRFFLRHSKSHLNNEAFAYLPDMIELDSNLSKFNLNYRYLAAVLNSALPVLTCFLKTDLGAACKFAAICGKKSAVEEILGDKITGPIDQRGHGIASFYSLGGQLECLEDFYKRWPKIFIHYIDAIAQMAALGGHIHILQYLKIEHHYDLKKKFPRANGTHDETLLSSAVKGGHAVMIDFLEKEGVCPSIGINLAVIAAAFGHWNLYHRLILVEDPFSGYLDTEELEDNALIIASNAFRSGNLEQGLALMKQYRLDPKILFVHVIEGGHSKVFWHFINNGLVGLTDRFKNDATVEHLIAEFGHVSLFKEVLRDPRPKNGVLAVDAQKKSTLHYAAKGGHYIMYAFLIPFFGNALQKDDEGNTVAHTAAASGSVWFIKRLMLTETGRIMMKGKYAKNNNGETVLHSAARFGDSNLLFMIIEDKNCGIDLFSSDDDGFMVFHRLASLAISKRSYWITLRDLVVKYGHELMDINAVDAQNTNVRVIMNAFHAEEYFPDSTLKAPTKK